MSKTEKDGWGFNVLSSDDDEAEAEGREGRGRDGTRGRRIGKGIGAPSESHSDEGLTISVWGRGFRDTCLLIEVVDLDLDWVIGLGGVGGARGTRTIPSFRPADARGGEVEGVAGGERRPVVFGSGAAAAAMGVSRWAKITRVMKGEVESSLDRVNEA